MDVCISETLQLPDWPGRASNTGHAAGLTDLADICPKGVNICAKLIQFAVHVFLLLHGFLLLR